MLPDVSFEALYLLYAKALLANYGSLSHGLKAALISKKPEAGPLKTASLFHGPIG